MSNQPDQVSEENQKLGDSIEQHLEAWELKLDESGKLSATQAFNLGCTIALIPAGLMVLIAYIATQAWLAALLTGVLMIIAIIGFANLAAIIARTKAMERVYNTQTEPEIQTYLHETGFSQEDLSNYAWENLPDSSQLLKFLPAPPRAQPQKKSISMFKFFRRKK